MNLAATGIRYGGCSMTVQTESHGAHRMLGSTRNAMLMIIEVTGMTTLAVLAAGGAGSAALEGAGSGIMTGEAAAAGMDLTAGLIRSCGCGMAVQTEGHGAHAMTMGMSVIVGGMTGVTGSTTVIGKGGAISVVHRRRDVTVRRRRGYRIDQIVTWIDMTAGAVVMDQVAGAGIDRHIIGIDRGCRRMTVGTESRIAYQGLMIAGMTSDIMTGGRTVIGR